LSPRGTNTTQASKSREQENEASRQRYDGGIITIQTEDHIHPRIAMAPAIGNAGQILLRGQLEKIIGGGELERHIQAGGEVGRIYDLLNDSVTERQKMIANGIAKLCLPQGHVTDENAVDIDTDPGIVITEFINGLDR